ncbi:HPt (histidine-containing phosphotransfer) domain-containing protein [Paraburkholderia sp. GAS41]|jgi:hypothetical protein
MDMMGPPSIRVLAQHRSRRFSHSARAASIRFAILLGSIVAFILLCIFFPCADAAPAGVGKTQAHFEIDLRPVAALAARDAVVARDRSVDRLSRRTRGIPADALDALSASENGLVQDGIAQGERHANTTWHALFALLCALAALTVVRLGGWCRARIAPKRAFAAPHPIQLAQPSVEPAQFNDHTFRQLSAAKPAESPIGAQVEAFDRNYLDALSNEGIDLHTFIRAWRQSMLEDLEQMHALRRRHDTSGLRASLHRLSGAVGLVGAGSLMEALRRASVAQPALEGRAIDALCERMKVLMKQLDTAIETDRSSS